MIHYTATMETVVKADLVRATCNKPFQHTVEHALGCSVYREGPTMDEFLMVGILSCTQTQLSSSEKGSGVTSPKETSSSQSNCRVTFVGIMRK